MRLGIAEIDSDADVTALANADFSGFGSINAQALVNVYANAVYSARGIILADAIVSANGGIIGEEWVNKVPKQTQWLIQ